MKIKIGLEVHVQLSTKSKIFCSCPTESSAPNASTCEICLGFPGSKPSINREAIYKAIQMALALNCNISPITFFSRKSYFYPDLPKNFQISQYEIPIASSGKLDSINIRRIHLEEDPGRLIHQGSTTLIDYNRSGIPLIEIVTEPDFKSIEEVRVFLQKLTIILEYLNIYKRASEASLRTDANISIDENERVELKNINGIKEIERALNYEIKRQTLDPPLLQQTRSWDSEKGISILTRTKETEEDYGYIFEPDLPKIEISKELIKRLRSELPELADEKIKRFIKQYKLRKDDAEILASEILLADLYEKVARKINPVLASKWLIRELQRVLHYNKKELHEVELDETHMIELLNLIESKKITETVAQKILERLVVKPFSVIDYVKKEKLITLSDKSLIEKHCKEAIRETPKAVSDYKSGEKKALHYIIGKVMQKCKGAATPNEVTEILKKLIK